NVFHELQLLLGAHKRNHDLWNNLDTFLGEFSSCFEDCSSLHCINFWVGYSEAAAAMTKHWVELSQAVHCLFQFCEGDTHFFREFLNGSILMRQELVERW